MSRAAVLLTVFACAVAAPASHAAPVGALTPAGCVTAAGTPPCDPGFGLTDVSDAAVSPDGAHLYAVSPADDAVAAFARRPDGTLAQLPGMLGCVSETGSAGRCTDGTALDGAGGVAVSPDGLSVYVASRTSSAVAVLARDPVTGALQPRSCVSETGSGGSCADGAGLRWATAVAVSPDGHSVYVASRTSDAVATFARDPFDGTVTPLPGTAACVAEGGAGGCTAGRGLDGATALAVDPLGGHVYVAARYGDAVAAFAREGGGGALSQLPGETGCTSRTGADGCAAAAGLDGAAGLAFDPDGRHLHVAAALSNALTVLQRDEASGALASLGCLSETPDDATRGTVGCWRTGRLKGAADVAVPAGGRSVHVAATGPDGVTSFRRYPASGRLGMLFGKAYCVTDSGSGGACADGDALRDAAALAAAPDGDRLYAAAPGGDGLAALARSTAPGAPSCRGASASTIPGEAVSVAVPCTDPTADPIAYLVDDAPRHGRLGSLDAQAGTLSYTPDPGFQGEDRFQLRATDSAEESEGVTVHVRVLAPPELPLPRLPEPPPGPSPPAGGDGEPKRRPTSARTTFLLSRAADGGFPDGPSRNAAVSHDQRIARVMAYESDATNIVADDTNGVTDVFVVRRQEPWGRDGTLWTPGPAELASAGLGGAPANGPSYRPALDGDSHHAPRCVAFISEASNLVPGDTNGRADAFVRDLTTGRIARVSVDSRGRQADGPTSEVEVDGACERVAFVADAPQLALTSSGRAGWGRVRTSRPRRGRRQVYVRVLRGGPHDRGFRGLTFLASASASGRAANGPSYDLSLARDGKSVAFASEATNLARGDRGRGADVYRRAFPRRYRRLGHGRGVQTLWPATRLVSATSRGRAGNRPSRHPSITDQGDYVAYETLATDLLPGDGNGVSDIARADLRRRDARQTWVSRSRHVGQPGNGSSNRPVISGAGEFVLFDSEATNLKPSQHVRDDRNAVRDVFLWNAPTGNVSLESRDADNGYLSISSSSPVTSSRGNYVPFESANPRIDLGLSRAAAAPTARLQQVYLRYLGPK